MSMSSSSHHERATFRRPLRTDSKNPLVVSSRVQLWKRHRARQRLQEREPHEQTCRKQETNSWKPRSLGYLYFSHEIPTSAKGNCMLNLVVSPSIPHEMDGERTFDLRIFDLRSRMQKYLCSWHWPPIVKGYGTIKSVRLEVRGRAADDTVDYGPQTVSRFGRFVWQKSSRSEAETNWETSTVSRGRIRCGAFFFFYFLSCFAGFISVTGPCSRRRPQCVGSGRATSAMRPLSNFQMRNSTSFVKSRRLQVARRRRERSENSERKSTRVLLCGEEFPPRECQKGNFAFCAFVSHTFALKKPNKWVSLLFLPIITIFPLFFIRSELNRFESTVVKGNFSRLSSSRIPWMNSEIQS